MAQSNNPKRPHDDLDGTKDSQEEASFAKRLRLDLEESCNDTSVEDEVLHHQEAFEEAVQHEDTTAPPGSPPQSLSGEAGQESDGGLSDVEADLDDLVSVYEEDITELRASINMVSEEISEEVGNATVMDNGSDDRDGSDRHHGLAEPIPGFILDLNHHHHTPPPLGSRPSNHFAFRQLRARLLARRQALRRWLSYHRGKQYNQNDESSEEEW
ncbi:hypothetical protein BGZ63DRAFT_421600 [Mariannaea sp. PMI_226]|nr:hypothetical protein BGZ63DRAFT_421600 [Mariannaea sp. PMI_226]